MSFRPEGRNLNLPLFALEMLAVGIPLSEIAKPEISNSGKIRIAPFERCIGLGVDPSGPAELNRLRKRMMTWLWASFTSSWVCERFSN